MLPTSMRAIEISRPGGPEVLMTTTRPLPKPGPGQILVRVRAAGVNRPDISQRMGNYAPPPSASDLPGLEAAGEVAALGEGATRWKLGDAVTALFPGGAYAEYAVTHQDHALPVPHGMDMTRAAALCETFFTVWTNVFMRGALRAGERFLVHGGTSGIGTVAIQLAHVFGARVFATAGSDEKCAVCLRLGAEQAINYRDADFVEALRAEGGANLILDMIGGDYFPRNLKAMADDGRLVQIATMNGAKSEIHLAQMMVRRLTLTGSTLRPQSDLAKAEIAAGLREKVWPLLDAGRIGPVIDSEFPLERASDAHRRMDEAHVGKVVMTVA